MTLDAVRTIQTPTLLVYGRDSHFISSYEFLHTALPKCKPVLLPGGEHFGPLEQPELLTEHIVNFLREPHDFQRPLMNGNGLPGLHPAVS